MSPLVILVVLVIWVAAFVVSSYLDGALYHVDGTYDILNPVDVTFIEDLFAISVVISFGLVLYFSLLSFDQFERMFLSAGLKRIASEEALNDRMKSGLAIINHATRESRMYFILLCGACGGQFLLFAGSFLFGENTWNGWNGPWTLGGTVFLAFEFFLLVIVGPPLAWRLLATTYVMGRIVGPSESYFETPNLIIDTSNGVGQAFRFAALTSAIPLATTPSLIIWLLTRGNLMIVSSVGAGAIIGAVVLIAFLVPTMAVVSAVKRKRQNEIDRIDGDIESFIGSASGSPKKPVQKDQVEMMLKWRETLAKDPVWPYGWLTTIGLAIITETIIAGLTSFI
jgi:hypothetical protein